MWTTGGGSLVAAATEVRRAGAPMCTRVWASGCQCVSVCETGWVG